MSSITKEFFIAPGEDLGKGTEDYQLTVQLGRAQLRNRWETPEGKNILERWKASGFKRSALDTLVGKYLGHTDLRGIDLSNHCINKQDLSNVDLFCAVLVGTNFEECNLSNSYLSEANIRSASFRFAVMDQVLIDNANFNQKTDFVGVKLGQIDFTLAEQLRDHAYSQQRIESLKRRYPRFAWFLWVVCDYGRSFGRFFTWCVGVTLFFAGLYYFTGALNHLDFWSALIFSLMTFVGGNSDIQVMSWLGRVLTVVQAISGYLMTGLLVAILVRRTIGD